MGAGGQDDAVDDEAQYVHGQASLPARHPFAASLPVVVAGTPTAAWTLCVPRTTGPGSANRFRFSRTPAQQVVDVLIDALVTPEVEVVLHRPGRRHVVRQELPLAPLAVLVEDCVHDLPHRVHALMPAVRRMPGLPRRDHGFDELSLIVGEITRNGLWLAHAHATTRRNPNA